MKKAGLIATLNCSVLIIHCRITKGHWGAFIKTDFQGVFERCTTSLCFCGGHSKLYDPNPCSAWHYISIMHVYISLSQHLLPYKSSLFFNLLSKPEAQIFFLKLIFLQKRQFCYRNGAERPYNYTATMMAFGIHQMCREAKLYDHLCSWSSKLAELVDAWSLHGISEISVPLSTCWICFYFQ